MSSQPGEEHTGQTVGGKLEVGYTEAIAAEMQFLVKITVTLFGGSC